MEFQHFYKVKKSQRHYKCFWCGEGIPKGFSLIRGAGVNDGFWSVKMHLECYQAQRYADFGEDGYDFAMYARGRTDDKTDMSPEYNELGKKIESFILPDSR